MERAPSPTESSRIAVLDGLRGIAIALILLHHLVQLHLPGAELWARVVNRLLALSWAGVDLFFVLSGFLIGGILMDHRSSPQLVRSFYLRRGLRILPLYYVTLLVIFLGLDFGGYTPAPAWVYGLFGSNIAFVVQHHWDLAALAITWSLAVEEQFYLVAPWVLRWVTPERLPRLLLVVIVAAWALRIAARYLDSNAFASHLLMPCRADAFAFGMLAACAVRSPSARAWLSSRRIAAWIPLAIAALPLVWLTRIYHSLADWSLPQYGYTALALFFASVIFIAVTQPPAALKACLSWPPLLSLGRLSYFIYLWHCLVLHWVSVRMGVPDYTLDSLAALATVVVSTAATWGLAWTSWRVFEGPLVKLGHRYAY